MRFEVRCIFFNYSTNSNKNGLYIDAIVNNNKILLFIIKRESNPPNDIDRIVDLVFHERGPYLLASSVDAGLSVILVEIPFLFESGDIVVVLTFLAGVK